MADLRTSKGLLWKGYSLVALALGIAYFLLGGNDDAQTVIYQLFILGVRSRSSSESGATGRIDACPGCSSPADSPSGASGIPTGTPTLWVLDKQAPYPSFADVAYLGGYPFLIAGVFVLARGGGRPRIGDLLDAAIVALAAGVVSTLFLLEPLLATSDPAFPKAIAVGFPVMDVVLLLALTQLLFRRRVTNFALRAFMVGAGALLVADAAYSYLGLEGAYTNGMFIDAGWLACYALWGIAALHPSMARIRSLPEQEEVGLSPWRIGALLAALLVAPIVLIVETIGRADRRRRDRGRHRRHDVAGRRARLAPSARQQEGADRARPKRRAASSRAGGRGRQHVGPGPRDRPTLGVGPARRDDLRVGRRRRDGRSWVRFIHPEDRERVPSTFDQAREQGGDFEHEYRFRRATARKAGCSPAGESSWTRRSPARAVGVAVDITDRHAMEEQLKQSEERLRWRGERRQMSAPGTRTSRQAR